MRMLVSVVTRLVPVMFVAIALAAPASSQDQSQAPCAAPEHRQFDFWLGDWDVFETGGSTKVARVRVERGLDGCALFEYYEDLKGLRGQSVSIYDRTRSVWHQTWVTNRGQLLSIEGRLQAGEMVLSGSYRGANGEETLVRGTWKRDGVDVREIAVTSIDGGRTWKTWFDLRFRRAVTNPAA